MKKQSKISSQLLFSEAKKMGLNPIWETNYGLFSVEFPVENKQFKRSYFFNTHFNFNGERGHILAKNKHFTRLILAKHGLPNIPWCLPENRQELLKFYHQNQPLICKPLLGQHSQNIKLVKSLEELDNCSLDRTIFEKFIQGIEFRYLVFQGEVVAVQRKELKPTESDPWHLYYIGLTQDKWDPNLTKQAVKVASIFKLQLAGVDFIIAPTGEGKVLEVNSTPGIVKMHQPDAGISVNIARIIWTALVEQPIDH